MGTVAPGVVFPLFPPVVLFVLLPGASAPAVLLLILLTIVIRLLRWMNLVELAGWRAARSLA